MFGPRHRDGAAPVNVPPTELSLSTIGLAREHWWRSVGMSGFARRRGANIRGSCEHRATREPKAVVCTLGTLNTDCGEAFSLLRFFVAEGPRNEVPPRTVANSDKKFSSHTTRANVSSSNPESTPTTDHRPTKPRPSANENNLANSAKKFSQQRTRAIVRSSNPAPPPPTPKCERKYHQ